MPSRPNPPAGPTPEEIAARAAELWQIAGSPAGGPDRFRAPAEAELRKQGEITRRAAADPASRPPERPTRK